MAEPTNISLTSRPMSMDVLGLINESRMTYGLRHQDYERYREYCTNRVHRLRQILKLTQSNNKKDNCRKPIPEKFSDVRFLHLYIYESERAWAYAKELEQESASSVDTRQRHHLVKRLKRASQHAQTLADLCEKQDVAIRTVLDIKAYASTMKGYLLFEQQKWQEAVTQFVKSRVIYGRFARNNSNDEQEALCYAAVDEIDTNIRVCAYKLQPSDRQHQDIEAVVSKYQQPELEAQLSKLGQQKQIEPKTMTWRDKEFTIKNEDLVAAVENARKTNSNSAWVKAEKLAKNALKDDKVATAKITSSKSAKKTEDLKTLFTFVEYNLFGSNIQHNLLQAQETEKSRGKPQQIVKLYDGILKNVEYIQGLHSVREDVSLDGELNVLSLYYKGCRCVQVALVYNELKKIAESLAIYQRGQDYVVQAKSGLSQIRSFSDDALLKVADKDLSGLEQTIHAGIWKGRAAWFLENGDQDEEKLTNKLSELTLDEEPLIKNLDNYPSAISPDHLVDFPPKFEAIPCKPFYFDLAANFVKYPDEVLDKRTSKPSGFWGLFGKK